MKPTRNIMKPSGMWNTKRRVWYQKNDDDTPTKPFFSVEEVTAGRDCEICLNRSRNCTCNRRTR